MGHWSPYNRNCSTLALWCLSCRIDSPPCSPILVISTACLQRSSPSSTLQGRRLAVNIISGVYSCKPNFTLTRLALRSFDWFIVCSRRIRLIFVHLIFVYIVFTFHLWSEPLQWRHSTLTTELRERIRGRRANNPHLLTKTGLPLLHICSLDVVSPYVQLSKTFSTHSRLYSGTWVCVIIKRFTGNYIIKYYIIYRSCIITVILLIVRIYL